MYLYKRMLIISLTEHKSMENCLFRDEYCFSSYVLSPILLSFVENFKNGVAYKRLTYKTRANSNLDPHQSNFLANKAVRLLLGLYV